MKINIKTLIKLTSEEASLIAKVQNILLDYECDSSIIQDNNLEQWFEREMCCEKNNRNALVTTIDFLTFLLRVYKEEEEE